MTLRFFRKKSGAADAAPEREPAEEAPATDEKPAPRTRRRRTTTTKSTTDKTKTTKTRRGTRGGRGRRSATKTAAPKEEEKKPAPPPPPAPNGAQGIEALLAHQQAVLEQMTERQLTALKGIQGSLSAIESRLATGGRVTEQPRIGVFVDVPNVMYAADRLKVSIDFAKLLHFLTRDRDLVRASAYAPISDDPTQRLETQRFVQPFVGLGYRIVTKPLKRYADGSMKANFDVELAIDILTMAERLDVVSLVSGDGDFRRLVELIASRGVRVEVIAFGQSMAAELRAVADQAIDLSEHLDELKA